MTRKEEIMERLEKIADAIWDINMKDRWMQRDYQKIHDLRMEEYRLQVELRKMEA